MSGLPSPKRNQGYMRVHVLKYRICVRVKKRGWGEEEGRREEGEKRDGDKGFPAALGFQPSSSSLLLPQRSQSFIPE